MKKFKKVKENKNNKNIKNIEAHTHTRACARTQNNYN